MTYFAVAFAAICVIAPVAVVYAYRLGVIDGRAIRNDTPVIVEKSKPAKHIVESKPDPDAIALLEFAQRGGLV